MRRTHLRMSGALAVVWGLLAAVHQSTLLGSAPTYAALSAVACVLVPGLCLRLVWPRHLRTLIFLLQTACLAGFLAVIAYPYWAGGRLGEWCSSVATSVIEDTAPLPETPELTIAFAVVVGTGALISEFLVFVTKTPGLACVPLLSAYLIDCFIPTAQASPLLLAVAVAASFFLLATDTLNRRDRWSRDIQQDSGSPRDIRHDSAAIVGRGALAVAALSIGGALALGLVIPELEPLVGNNSGSHGPAGLTLTDPSLDLRQNLRRGRKQVVLAYATDAPDGVRLQMASLPEFTHAGWELTPIQMIEGTDQLNLPAPPGLRPPYIGAHTRIAMKGFETTYLPVPYAPTYVKAEGIWAYDPSSLMIHAAGPNPDTAVRNLTFEVASAQVEPTAAQLAHAGVAGAPPEYRQLPAGLPDRIEQLARDITKDATTPAAKAAALQAYLRGAQFHYDLAGAPQSTGTQALEEFLFTTKTGYCEQFAGAMSLMARQVGLPSRVVIGFLPGARGADGQWEVTNHDMHAWSEVWFDGFGWVRFDATPGIVSGEPPSWTNRATPPTHTPTPSHTPTRAPAPTPSQQPTPTATPSATPEPAPTTDDFSSLFGALGCLGGLGAASAVAAIPALLRRRRRAQRFAATSPDAAVLGAWEELRDVVIDHGGTWQRETPRTLAALVSESLSGSARRGVWDLAIAVEQVRFGGGVEQAPAGLDQTVQAVATVLDGRQSTWSRWMSVAWPRSLFSARSRQ